MTRSEHFSERAGDYSRHRPTYPEALLDWLAEQAPERGTAWDVATGDGQAAITLARRFARVAASEASPAQLARAPGEPVPTGCWPTWAPGRR